MRYALFNGERHEAEPHLVGTCPGCAKAMIAKCGSQRIHHWAHKGARGCDPWWEPETPWHRTWKGHFDESWQEVALHDEGGQKHIADVRTEHGLVLEFQHSHISPVERQSREDSYRNMVWIVDGTRRKRDLPRFIDGRRSLRFSPWTGIYTTPFPYECFPSDWLDSAAPVFFDFAGMDPVDPRAGIEQRLLWGLLPGRADGHAVVVAFAREHIILAARTRPQIVPAREIVATIGSRYRAARVEAYRYAARPAWRRRTLRRHTARL
ncbi:competence protein [Mesorhizobium sp. M2D.F.Ca.ET.185.01.1.1]|nr:competence protein [Mesorhizobium sp. M2D.F.Ca.ET.140.01.1.1]TGP16479.1 competence protein [Mesorhizobium sp. M2D.F.Ca.ET.233.01.1.1]TGP37301.1 competence protein [Mesorhizobium sp. M2D.F.Ca.ET.232.01.1.1]TGP65577.1 competence protein [Mesorhizobium sp. M2D.F.Ca.ET.226.01.1.1]TGP72058.1 competence protein [Mesorhizobium sp. M2D.F.Ca.ET.225.01.1.1]TGP74709.1 competence protein [Mesorhizobium sp. M2D.F.Ca.ET.224.01.1.1]TGP77492.1 competence protein [bacterium M00.F.Ca.ET.227.01.1.1]TGP93287